MACPCSRKSQQSSNTATPTDPISGAVVHGNSSQASTGRSEAIAALKSTAAVHDLRDGIYLPQCYLCAKKHLSRALMYFEEYHTGYPDRIKLVIQSLKVAESEVNKAFQLYCKIMGQLDMAAGELIGNSAVGGVLNDNHLVVARAIREERLKFEDNPLYVPDIEKLLTDVQILQYSE